MEKASDNCGRYRRLAIGARYCWRSDLSDLQMIIREDPDGKPALLTWDELHFHAQRSAPRFVEDPGMRYLYGEVKIPRGTYYAVQALPGFVLDLAVDRESLIQLHLEKLLYTLEQLAIS